MPRLENNIVHGDRNETDSFEGFQSIGQYVLERLKYVGEKIVLVDPLRKENYNANRILRESISFARGLQRLNVGKGDTVGICCENRLEFTTCAFGTIATNASLAPYNVTYTERELIHALNISRPKVLIATALTIEKAAHVMAKCSFIKHLIAIDNRPIAKNSVSYRTLINQTKEHEINDFISQPTDVDNSIVLVLCSSGTTGLPKGVALTHRNVMAIIRRQFARLAAVDLNFFSIIPWFHGYGCLTVLSSICIGIKLVFLPKFQEKQFLETIEKYKIDAAMLVPPILVFLAKHPLVDKYDLSSLKIIFCGAAPLSKETENAVMERIGVLAVRQGYGLSETTLSVLAQTDENCKPGSVGTVCDNVSAKVIDIESGEILGPNHRGELCFQGDVIMKGYIGDEKATAETIDKDGWLHTGDIGYYDNDLSFFIVDRIKELIKYKAFQVPPAELEALLLTNPKIKDAAVVGLPDEECGELPLAFIVKQPNANLSENEVIDFIAEKVSPPKRLRGGVRFTSAIPKNPSGKILRRELKAMLKSIIKSKL